MFICLTDLQKTPQWDSLVLVIVTLQKIERTAKVLITRGQLPKVLRQLENYSHSPSLICQM